MATKLPAEAYLQYWQTASEEEIGLHITVEPNDQILLVNALYEARKTFGGFENLMIFQPPPAGTVYIARETVELPD